MPTNPTRPEAGPVRRRTRDERLALILAFLEDRRRTGAHPPTVREICRATNIPSTATVASDLEELRRRGLVQHRPGSARGVALPVRAQRSGRQTAVIPVVALPLEDEPLGSLPAQGAIHLDRRLTGGRRLLAIDPGEMEIDGLPANGRHLLVLAAGTPGPGEAAVVLVDGQARIGALYPHPRQAWLRFFPAGGGEMILGTGRGHRVLGRLVSVVASWPLPSGEPDAADDGPND